jgi:hypothetical protein
MPMNELLEPPRKPGTFFPRGRISKNITMSPRAKALVERAAKVGCTTHSAIIETLVYDHIEELIAKMEG